jgi:hypothetical protein
LSALRSTKLAVLVSGITGVPTDELQLSVQSSSIVGCVAKGRAYVLADSISDLGSALHWFHRQGAEGLTVLADQAAAGDLARRAGLFQIDIEVLGVEGAALSAAVPSPVPTPPELSSELWQSAAVIVDAGLTLIDDHGRLTGEILGLEVARVEPASPTDPSSEAALHVGVGEADRQLHGYVHGHLSDVEKLRQASATVAELRRPGNGMHPLSLLARPRWLRSILMADPSMAGLSELEPLVPLRAKAGVFDTEPAAAYSSVDRVTVVCSVGVDLDLVPEAADYRQRVDSESKLLLVLPPRDVKLATGGVIDMVANTQILAVEPPW